MNAAKGFAFILITAVIAGTGTAMAKSADPSVNVSSEVRNMKDKKAYKRTRAIERLGRTNDRTAASEVANHLKNEKDLSVRSAAVVSLGKMGNDTAVNALRETYLNESESVDLRMEALEGLTRVRDNKAAFDTVVAATNDKNPLIRKVAASLLWSNYPRAVTTPVLNNIYRTDTDQSVKDSVKQMLDFKPKG